MLAAEPTPDMDKLTVSENAICRVCFATTESEDVNVSDTVRGIADRTAGLAVKDSATEKCSPTLGTTTGLIVRESAITVFALCTSDMVGDTPTESGKEFTEL